MNHPRVCGVCENEMNETDADVPVCKECKDVLEIWISFVPGF